MKKEILKIRVRAGTETFWVCNEKKIEYYLNLTKNVTTTNLNKQTEPSIKIIKAVYK